MYSHLHNGCPFFRLKTQIQIPVPKCTGSIFVLSVSVQKSTNTVLFTLKERRQSLCKWEYKNNIADALKTQSVWVNHLQNADSGRVWVNHLQNPDIQADMYQENRFVCTSLPDLETEMVLSNTSDYRTCESP